MFLWSMLYFVDIHHAYGLIAELVKQKYDLNSTGIAQ